MLCATSLLSMSALAQWSGSTPIMTNSDVLVNGNLTTTSNSLNVYGGYNKLPLQVYYKQMGNSPFLYRNALEVNYGDDNGFLFNGLKLDHQGKFMYRWGSLPSSFYYFNVGSTAYFNDNAYFKGRMILGNDLPSTPAFGALVANQKLLVNGNAQVIGQLSIGNLKATSPYNTYKLSVDGDIICKRQVVQISNWADFVFAKDYHLKPLQEVEAYVKTNNHLPNMPSESQVVAQGLDLGEMVKLQQQKIEELTLYLIDLQKQLDAIKSSH